MKECTVCNEDKGLQHFYNRAASVDGLAYRCKDCERIAVNKYRKENRATYLARQRKANLKYKYGISVEEFDEMLEAQGGECAICYVELERSGSRQHTAKTLCVDHCHTTGEVRGLLCANCNR